jgi:uncharacterized protein DUF1045
MNDDARYAVYWAPPPEHPLWQAGCTWLGRDPRGAADGRPRHGARAPWRYGFHATLKAPMRLRQGACADDFVAAVARLAERWTDFEMPPLRVGWLDGFLALRPLVELGASHPLRRVADDCTAALDDWRRAPTPQETAARLAGLTDPVECALVERWGYPYVFERWRFHMTLSDRGPADPEELQQRAEAHFARALAQPLCAHGIAVFVEAGPERPFKLAWRWPLRRSPRAGHQADL